MQHPLYTRFFVSRNAPEWIIKPKIAPSRVIFALAAYTMWGIAPIYFKSLAEVPPVEILIHRIVWSFFLLAGLIHFGQGWHSFREVMKNKTKMLYLLASSVLIGGNWLLFIWRLTPIIC